MTDYLADWRKAQEEGHHEDCDGYMTVHRVHVVSDGPHLHRAICDDCGPLHVGAYGQIHAAERAGYGHSHETACDGRCHLWDAA